MKTLSEIKTTTTSSITDLLGIKDRLFVQRYFSKNWECICFQPTILASLDKFRDSLDEKDEVRQAKYKIFHQRFCEYVHQMEQAEKRPNFGRCIVNLFPVIECECDYVLTFCPGNLLTEIIDAYYGVYHV